MNEQNPVPAIKKDKRVPPLANRFKKGQSGNPSGRPKGLADFSTTIRQFLFARAKKGDKTNLQALVERLYTDDPKTLLAYGFGKPVETHELTTPTPLEVNVKPGINIEEFRVMAQLVFGAAGPNGDSKPVHPAITDHEASDVPKLHGT